MITLSRNSILYRLFLWTLKWVSEYDVHKHQEQTNLCYFLRTLVFGFPATIFLMITIGPIVLMVFGIGEALKWAKMKLRRNRPNTYFDAPKSPSKVSVMYDTLHGKICPTVVFE